MHVFLLILTIAGRAEHAVAVCDTYKECSDLGHDVQVEATRTMHLQPRDVTYRIIPAIITPGAES